MNDKLNYFSMFNGSVPKMTFGKYLGVALDKLPNSYLRWLITSQAKLPKEWIRIINEKLKSSEYEKTQLTISRHAIDMYSVRFLDRWVDRSIGLATHIVREADQAWLEGVNRSKKRHQDDSIIKEFDGIKFVFKTGENCIDYRELITIME